jgi:hypothetical protein
MAESVAVRRLCLVAGIEGYSQNDSHIQVELQRRLMDTLGRTLKSANVALDRTVRLDRGDGQLILLPVGVKAAAVVPSLIRGLLEHLDHDRNHASLIPLRLRVSIVPGSVTRGPAGYIGRSVAMATRLAESPAVREELDAQRAALFALIVPDDLYRDVFVHGKGQMGADGFRRVTVDMPDKERREDAWVRGWELSSPEPSGNSAVGTLRNTVLPAISTMSASVGDMLDNPEIESALEEAAHDSSDNPHEEWVAVSGTAAEDHATYLAYDDGNLVEGYGDREYTTVDYESFEPSPDSHDELY